LATGHSTLCSEFTRSVDLYFFFPVLLLVPGSSVFFIDPKTLHKASGAAYCSCHGPSLCMYPTLLLWAFHFSFLRCTPLQRSPSPVLPAAASFPGLPTSFPLLCFPPVCQVFQRMSNKTFDKRFFPFLEQGSFGNYWPFLSPPPCVFLLMQFISTGLAPLGE